VNTLIYSLLTSPTLSAYTPTYVQLLPTYLTSLLDLRRTNGILWGLCIGKRGLALFGEKVYSKKSERTYRLSTDVSYSLCLPTYLSTYSSYLLT